VKTFSLYKSISACLLTSYIQIFKSYIIHILSDYPLKVELSKCRGAFVESVIFVTFMLCCVKHGYAGSITFAGFFYLLSTFDIFFYFA